MPPEQALVSQTLGSPPAKAKSKSKTIWRTEWDFEQETPEIKHWVGGLQDSDTREHGVGDISGGKLEFALYKSYCFTVGNSLMELRLGS